MPVIFAIKCFVLYVVITAILPTTEGDLTYTKESEKHLTSLKLPQCQSCKMVVDSFLKGMERTARNHFGGGDTAWEEEKLGSYASSEVRLVEIQEHLCDESRGRDQCLTLAEAWDEHLENWWLEDRKLTPDLMQYLCIDTVKQCCPADHFGPTCEPCPGFPDRICNNNGKCKGNGTRKGNGQCSCDVGYTGKFCDECDISYFVAYKDDKKLLCSKCHVACQGACTQAGVKGCLVCGQGWTMDSEMGCIDVDECLATPSPCKKNDFCVNNEGSYSCLACDPSCSGCTGDGPDMCIECAVGFVFKDNFCVDSSKLTTYSEMTRYVTYIGLLVATFIIFQNSPWLASGIGLFVAIYVTTSEYMLGTNFFSSVQKYFKS